MGFQSIFVKLVEDDELATAPDPREVSFFCLCPAGKKQKKKDTACGRVGTCGDAGTRPPQKINSYYRFYKFKVISVGISNDYL